MNLPMPCWSNNGLCFDVHWDHIGPLFDHRYVEIKPIETSLHQTDSDTVMARVSGVMQFHVFAVADKETALTPEFESHVKRKLLDEMYIALYGPIAARVGTLKSMVAGNAQMTSVIEELEVLLWTGP